MLGVGNKPSVETVDGVLPDYVTTDDSTYIPWQKVEKVSFFRKKHTFEDGMWFRCDITL